MIFFAISNTKACLIESANFIPHIYKPSLEKILIYYTDSVPGSAGVVKVFDDYWQDQVDRQLAAATVTGRFTLLRACRPDITRPDLILYLPLGRIARSRLVRWRLGRFTSNQFKQRKQRMKQP
ncbi:hypothetical protein HMPREF1544_08196 [Mucor circinelloides 1006PhL]|uniref:Uncharacterized protein n=1 Tax=Mucor circinelloides f. circinelloides (strain 1006PhL) TaxID=1220926 RepID=S2J4J2_MUCC1|nr:hypothetical protein HMPREF1544_08196 [Mucor circinelloides 1006PhL]